MRVASRFPTIASTVAAALLLAACGGETTGPAGPPAAPANLTVTPLSSTSVQVSFDAVSGATGYRVQRATGAAGTDWATVGTPAGSPWTDNGLAVSSTYSYRVAALAGSDASDYSAPVQVTTQDKPVQVVSQNITASTTWTNDRDYLLQGFIKVTNGATLTIQEGTTIKGDFNTLGSSLFILRGARIQALGTATAPIVFTSSQPEGQRLAGDWGGLIIVGNGIINRGAPVILEGTGTSAANPQVDYSGGTNNADDSGILRYVRIEFAGFGSAPNVELNSLTLAAVGSGTEIHHVQAMHGLDDSFEWFGGAVDTRYLVSYNAGDDHFDMSEGHQGRHQFLIGYQNTRVVPRPPGILATDPQGIENDGCDGANCLNGQNSLPLTQPMIANFTLVGVPATVAATAAGDVGMMIRRGVGGYYLNGVVARWSRAGISLRDQNTLNRITAGELVLNNILLAEVGAAFQPQSGATVQGTLDQAANAIESSAATATSLFAGLPSAPTVATLDWTPSAGSPARTGGLATFPAALAARAGGFITGTSYRGAVDPNGAKWWQGWTNYATN